MALIRMVTVDEKEVVRFSILKIRLIELVGGVDMRM